MAPKVTTKVSAHTVRASSIPLTHVRPFAIHFRSKCQIWKWYENENDMKLVCCFRDPPVTVEGSNVLSLYVTRRARSIPYIFVTRLQFRFENENGILRPSSLSPFSFHL